MQLPTHAVCKPPNGTVHVGRTALGSARLHSRKRTRLPRAPKLVCHRASRGGRPPRRPCRRQFFCPPPLPLPLQVEEISAAISHKKANDAANNANDPLEQFCGDNPDADECRCARVLNWREAGGSVHVFSGAPERGGDGRARVSSGRRGRAATRACGSQHC